MEKQREPAAFAYGKRLAIVSFSLIILLLALTACGRSTPPGPNAVFGAVEGKASYLLLDWQEGLRVLIWDDVIDGGHDNNGSGSTTDPVYHQRGGAQTADGRGYEYSLETSGGQQGNFTIDGAPYDLSQGSVFLISVTGDEKAVRQLDVDLAGLSPTYVGIQAFGQATPEIAAFIADSAAAPGR